MRAHFFSPSALEAAPVFGLCETWRIKATGCSGGALMQLIRILSGQYNNISTFKLIQSVPVWPAGDYQAALLPLLPPHLNVTDAEAEEELFSSFYNR